MILVDTGLIVAFFNPKDSYHAHSHNVLQTLRELLLTTIPVLTEAFNLLGPGSKRALGLGAFVQKKGITAWVLEDESLNTALLLMEKYADKPMDLIGNGGAGIGYSANFYHDRNDFLAYRIALEHSFRGLELL